jgi:DNA transformation protein
MPPSASYLDYIKDLFAPFGAISVRRMFGGAGVYCDGDFFAIFADDALWLKADAETRGEFEKAGSGPFVYERRPGVEGRMSYYAAPDEIYDDEDALRHWTGLALAAARRAKRPHQKKTV